MPGLKPHPDCEGPKLAPFTDDFASHDIEFIKCVEVGAAHSLVFKTKIDGKIYAVKLFLNPYLVDAAPLMEFPSSQEMSDLAAKHLHPFECECRAFGRLKEVGAEDLAVRAHGYIAVYLTERMRQLVIKGLDDHRFWQLGISTLDMFLGRDPEATDDEPVMGIVKDWVEDEDPDGNRQVEHFPQMFQNLLKLHRCGVVTRDIHAGQYINGIFLDFSLAWTIPHIYGSEMGLRPSWHFLSIAAYDIYLFQTKIIDLWNKGIDDQATEPSTGTPKRKRCSLRVYPTVELYDRLRPLAHRQRPHLPLADGYWGGVHVPMMRIPPYDPADFDWKEAGAGVGAGNTRVERTATAKSEAKGGTQRAGGTPTATASRTRKAKKLSAKSKAVAGLKGPTPKRGEKRASLT